MISKRRVQMCLTFVGGGSPLLFTSNTPRFAPQSRVAGQSTSVTIFHLQARSQPRRHHRHTFLNLDYLTRHQTHSEAGVYVKKG